MESVALSIAMLIGAALIYGFSPRLMKSLRARTWTKMEAKIANAGYDTMTPPDGSRAEYYPWVVYDYVVGQKSYRSDRVYLQRSSYYDMPDADSHVAKLPTGSALPIWVNPENSFETAMKPGIGWGDLIGVLFGCTLIGFAGYKLLT